MLARQLWRLSEAGEPVVLLGRPVDPADAALFGRLLERGVLRHAGQQTSWDVCDGCDCGRDDRPIRWMGDAPVAICVADRGRDLVLTPDDLAAFEVSIPHLIGLAAAASGLSDQPEEVEAGVWKLGTRPDGAVFCVPTRLSMFRPGLLVSIRAVEPERHVLLLGPEIPIRQRVAFAQAGILHATLHERAGSATPQNPIALDLAFPTRAGEQKVRLVLEAAGSTASFDGRTTALQPRRFQLLRLLVRRLHEGKPFVSSAEIHAEMFGNTTSGSRARGLIEELRKQLISELETPDDLIQTRSNLGYGLGLSAREVSVRG